MTSLGSIVGGGARNVRGVGAPTALGTYLGGGAIDTPAGLGWDPSWTIYQGNGRHYSTTLDTATLKTSGVSTTLYVSPLGANGNAGTTPGAGAKATIEGALAVGGTKTIYMQAGTYYGWGSSSVAADTNIIAYGDGPVLLCSAPNPSSLMWASEGSGAYSTTVAEPYSVADYADADVYGIARWLVPRASVASVKASGGWYFTAGTLTIKTSDARAPDTQILCPPLATNGFVILNAAVDLYIEGISTFGSYHAIYAVSAGVGRLTVVDCRLLSPRSVGIRVDVAASDVTVIRTWCCGALGVPGGYADGGNYTSAKVLEVDCVMVQNGDVNAPGNGASCNGSSGHAATKVIRCGGIYGGARSCGPAIADVAGCSSLNLGVTCHAVAGGTDPTNQVASLHIDGAGTMWVADALLAQKIMIDATMNLRNTGYVAAEGTPGAW